MTWRELCTTEDHSHRPSQHCHLSLKVQLALLEELQALRFASNDVPAVLVEEVVHRPAITAANSLDFSNYY